MCLYLHSRPLVRQSSNGLQAINADHGRDHSQVYSAGECRAYLITAVTLQSVQLHLLQNSTQTRLCRFPFVGSCLS